MPKLLFFLKPKSLWSAAPANLGNWTQFAGADCAVNIWNKQPEPDKKVFVLYLKNTGHTTRKEGHAWSGLTRLIRKQHITQLSSNWRCKFDCFKACQCPSQTVHSRRQGTVSKQVTASERAKDFKPKSLNVHCYSLSLLHPSPLRPSLSF